MAVQRISSPPIALVTVERSRIAGMEIRMRSATCPVNGRMVLMACCIKGMTAAKAASVTRSPTMFSTLLTKVSHLRPMAGILREDLSRSAGFPPVQSFRPPVRGFV